jgi:hypothetical protein
MDTMRPREIDSLDQLAVPWSAMSWDRRESAWAERQEFPSATQSH